MIQRPLDVMFLAPAVLSGLVIHELAHGLVADRLGDPTPRSAGRLTLNPIRHMDPLGTALLFLVHIGWARPVPIRPANFRNPRKGLLWVSLAGPLANLLIALGCGLVLRVLASAVTASSPGAIGAIFTMLFWGMVINLTLAAFNLLPLPPLDGGRVLKSLLPSGLAGSFRRFEQWGPLLFLAALLTGRSVIWSSIRPVVHFFGRLFAGGEAVQLLNSISGTLVSSTLQTGSILHFAKGFAIC